MHYGCRKESVDPLDLCSLTKTHQSIGQKMDQMDELVEVYRQKQEQHFLSTFAHVLARMSSELNEAQQNYLSIDLKVKQNQQCLAFANQLRFFRDECFSLRERVFYLEEQTKTQKELIQTLERDKMALSCALERKTKECLKRSLQKKILKTKLKQSLNQSATLQPSARQNVSKIEKQKQEGDLNVPQTSYSMWKESANIRRVLAAKESFLDVKNPQIYFGNVKGTMVIRKAFRRATNTNQRGKSLGLTR